MKTITLDQFQELITQKNWSRHQEIDTSVEELEGYSTNDDGDTEIVKVDVILGSSEKISKFQDITITYNESFQMDQYMPETFVASVEGLDDVWKIEGLKVIDEDNDILDVYDLAEYLNDEFSEIDYSKIKETYTDESEFDKDSDMETFEIEIDNAPNLKFKGEIIAKVASSDNNAAGHWYSGQAGRWAELVLYKTSGGKFICHQIGRTCHQGERNRYSGQVCKTIDEVIDFFGHRWLAKELYAEAKISAAVEVD